MDLLMNKKKDFENCKDFSSPTSSISFITMIPYSKKKYK